MFATPPFASKPAAVVKSVSAPPPAFEPAGRTKSTAPKKSDTKTGHKTGGAKPAVKADRLAAPVRKTRKAAAAPSAKGRKGVAAAAAARQSAPSAGSSAGASALPADGKTAVSPGSCMSDGSGLDDAAGGAALAAADTMQASSPAFPFGSAPRGRAPMTGYSGVFGTGLHHQGSSASGRGQAPQATVGKETVGDPFGRSPAAARLRSGEGAPHGAQQAAQVPSWAGGGGGKRAMGYGEWRGGVPSSQSSPLQQPQQKLPQPQQQLSNARSDSPTTATTLDSFNMKLSLESPTRGSVTLRPPPPPPHHGYPYMLHHQFPHPHHQHACFNHMNWVGGRYPGQPQQPHGFPAELTSPVDIHTPFQKHGSGSREFHAFSKVDDTSEVDASNNAGEAAEACAAGGEGATGKAAAAATVCEDPAPRRTGVMSYLLHQRSQSPPLESSPSPPAPPTAPIAVDVMYADFL